MSLISEHAVPANAFLSECIDFKRRTVPRGSFMRKLALGELPRDCLLLWAKEFYFYVEPAIPTIAAWLAAAPILPDREIYKLVARNLAGEMGFIGEAEHHDLYLQFCAGLGLSREDLLEHLPLASTIGAASTMGVYCRSSFEEGLGAFGLAVELQVPGQPNGAEIIYGALRRQYELDEKTLEFWKIHIAAEEEHGDNARRALQLCGQTREQQIQIRRAFRFSVVAHAGMSEGFDRLMS